MIKLFDLQKRTVKKDVTAKMALFGLYSPHVTISHCFRVPPFPVSPGK